MEQIFGVIGAGSLFLSYCAYCEARDALQSTAFHISPSRAKMAGLFAAGVTLTIGWVVCLLLLRSGVPYDASL